MGLMAPEPVMEVIVREYEDGRATVQTLSRDRSMATAAPHIRALLINVAREIVMPEHLR